MTSESLAFLGVLGSFLNLSAGVGIWLGGGGGKTLDPAAVLIG